MPKYEKNQRAYLYTVTNELHLNLMLIIIKLCLDNLLMDINIISTTKEC